MAQAGEPDYFFATTLMLKHLLLPCKKSRRRQMAIESSSKNTILIGRILLSLIFLVSAAGKLANFNGTAGMMSGKGFPVASLFLIGALAFEFLGGLSVLTGFKARLG